MHRASSDSDFWRCSLFSSTKAADYTMPERYVCCVYIFVENCPCRVQGGGNISREVCHVPPEFKVRFFSLCKFGRSRSEFSQAVPRARLIINSSDLRRVFPMAIFSPFVSSLSGNRGKKPIKLYNNVRVVARVPVPRLVLRNKASARPSRWKVSDASEVGVGAFCSGANFVRLWYNKRWHSCCLSTFIMTRLYTSDTALETSSSSSAKSPPCRDNRKRLASSLINSHRESMYPSYFRARSAENSRLRRRSRCVC